MGFLIAAVGEELGMEALADEPALQVDHGGHHRVDGAGLHLGFQFIQCFALDVSEEGLEGVGRQTVGPSVVEIE